MNARRPARVDPDISIVGPSYRVPLVHPMPRKGRRAVKAARAREEALKAERRMGEVLRGKELTEVMKRNSSRLTPERKRKERLPSAAS